MHKKCILTICICTYNRINHLKKLFDSIPPNYNKNIEILIIDDGSTDNTKELVIKYSNLLNLRYYYQNNLGRGYAINYAINLAKGEFLIIMDSDDYFINNGVECIISSINFINSKMKKNLNCLLFPTSATKNFKKLPNNLISNFLKIRFDYKIKGDLKEVVQTSLLKKTIQDVNIKFRRFPTLLLWTHISNFSDCLCINHNVAFKNYLNDGLSKHIYKYKILNSEPMYKMYKLIYQSKKYDSILYRVKSKILFNRYKLHKFFYLPEFKDLPFYLLGIFFYLFDKLYLSINDKP
tara:strand:- start:3924 stop:4802 length:879 start_codon:yes stop_codon:yes gene_type:complete